jgi:hypothetical protein
MNTPSVCRFLAGVELDPSCEELGESLLPRFDPSSCVNCCANFAASATAFRAGGLLACALNSGVGF